MEVCKRETTARVRTPDSVMVLEFNLLSPDERVFKSEVDREGTYGVGSCDSINPHESPVTTLSSFQIFGVRAQLHLVEVMNFG